MIRTVLVSVLFRQFDNSLFYMYLFLKLLYFSTLCIYCEGPGGSMSQVVGLPNNSYKPITNTAWVRARLCKLQKGWTRLAATSDQVYQLLAHGRWFSPGTLASSTTKTGRHDITEILLKVALHTKNQSYIYCILIYKVLSLSSLEKYQWMQQQSPCIEQGDKNGRRNVSSQKIQQNC